MLFFEKPKAKSKRRARLATFMPLLDCTMSLEDQIIELSDTVELLTLDKEQLLIDKELLEEKCLQLQSELDKALATANSSPVKQTVNVHDSPEYKRVCEENVKIKEALVHVAEVSNREKEQLKKQTAKIEEFERLVHELQSYKERTELELDELRQNVDSMSAFESMIEKLTNDNSELSVKVSEYKQTISELEDSIELNEELDHQQRKQIEEDFRTIENLNSTISTLERRFQEKEQTVHEYVRKLEQIKELYTISKKEVDRLNLLLSSEFQESKIIESKLQEAVKLRVQCEDLSQELLLTRFHTFQTSQQKVRYQIFFSHMDSIFGGNSYFLEESKLLNAEVLALSTLTTGLESNRSLVDIIHYMVNYTSNNSSSSSTTSSFIFAHPIFIGLLPHLSTIYSLSIQLQSGISHAVLRLLKDQSLKRLSIDQEYQREVAQLTNLLMNGRNTLIELMTLSIKVFGSLRQFAYQHQQQLSSSSSSSSSAPSTSSSLSENGSTTEVDVTAFNSIFFEYGNAFLHISKSLAMLVRNVFAPSNSQELTDPLVIPSLTEINQSSYIALQNIAANDVNAILANETILLLMSNIIECSGLAVHFQSSENSSSPKRSTNTHEGNAIEEILRSIKFEIDQLLKNIRRSNIAAASHHTSVSTLLDCYHRLVGLCESANGYLISLPLDIEHHGVLLEALKTNVLVPLRKVSNAVAVENVASLDSAAMVYMKYFPGTSLISSVRGRDSKMLTEQYQQYQDKYWHLLLQGSNDLIPSSFSTIAVHDSQLGSGNQELAWKQRVSDLRQIITARFNASSEISDDGESGSSDLRQKGKKDNLGTPQKASSSITAEAAISKQQYQQLLQELDIKKDELRAAMNKCEELENLIQNSNSKSSDLSNDTVIDKLSKEVKTLEAALSTIEIKSDSLAKENKQLKQQIATLGGSSETSLESMVLTSSSSSGKDSGKPVTTRRRSQLETTSDGKSAKLGNSSIEAEFAALLNSVPAGRSKQTGSNNGSSGGKDSSSTTTNQSLNEKVMTLSEQLKYWRKLAFKRVAHSLLPLETMPHDSYSLEVVSGTTKDVQVSINSIYGSAKQDFHAAYLQLRKERAKRVRLQRLSEKDVNYDSKSNMTQTVANYRHPAGWTRVSGLQRRNSLVYKILTHGSLTLG